MPTNNKRKAKKEKVKQKEQEIFNKFECPICYHDFPSHQSMVILPCECQACTSCLLSWVKTTLTEGHLQEDYPIPCVNSDCKKTFKIRETLSSFPSKNQKTINSLLFKGYLSHEKDIADCPNPKCTYAGVIDLHYCPENLTCDACGTSWRHSQQHSTRENLNIQVKKLMTHRNELFSTIVKYFVSKKCPKCKVKIQKNEDCDSMKCSRCKQRFCWLCLQTFPAHADKIHMRQLHKQIFIFFGLCILFVFPVLFLLTTSPIQFLFSWTIYPAIEFAKTAFLWVCNWIGEALLSIVLFNCLFYAFLQCFNDKPFFIAVTSGCCYLIYVAGIFWTVLKVGLIELAIAIVLKLYFFILYIFFGKMTRLEKLLHLD